jgi:Zn-finger nucleic acid-binding protein
MKCPICDTLLITDHRLGVEIDTCPECRGMWLDRGELTQVLDRSAESGSSGLPADSLEPVAVGAGHRLPEAGRRGEQSFWMAVLNAD